MTRNHPDSPARTNLHPTDFGTSDQAPVHRRAHRRSPMRSVVVLPIGIGPDGRPSVDEHQDTHGHGTGHGGAVCRGVRGHCLARTRPGTRRDRRGRRPLGAVVTQSESMSRPTFRGHANADWQLLSGAVRRLQDAYGEEFPVDENELRKLVARYHKERLIMPMEVIDGANRNPRLRQLLAPFPPRAGRPQPQDRDAGVASCEVRPLFQAGQEAARARQSRVL